MAAIAIIRVDVVGGPRRETGERVSVFVRIAALEDPPEGIPQFEVHRHPGAASRAAPRREARVPVGCRDPVRVDGDSSDGGRGGRRGRGRRG